MSPKNILFVPNPGFDREYLASSEPVPMLTELGDAVVDRAQRIARKRSENMADGIELEVGLDTDDVQTARINATDFKSHWWEFGHRGRIDPFLRPAAEDIVGPVRGGDK